MRKSILTGAAFLLLFSLSIGPAFAGTSGGAAWYNVARYRNNLAVRGVFATMTCPRGNARGTIRQNWVGVGTYGTGGGSVGWEIDPQGSLYARWTGGNGVGVLMPLAYGSTHRFGIKMKDFTPGTTEYYVDGRRITTAKTGFSWGLPIADATRCGSTSNVSDFTGIQYLDNDGNTWKNASLPPFYDNDPVYNGYQPQIGWIAVR